MTIEVNETSPPRTTPRRAPGAFVLGVLGVLIFLAAWELASRLGLVPQTQVPPATVIIATLGQQLGTSAFWISVGHTMSQWGIGLALSMLISIPAGILLGSSELVWRSFRPLIEFFRTVPGNVLLPLAILLWGLSLNSAVFLIVFGCSWSLTIQTMYGARDVDEGARDTARAFRFTTFEKVRWVTFPSALPHVATGLRIASATALIIAISAEILIGIDGLGKDIALARTAGDVNSMYALILASSFLGVGIHVVFSRIEKYLLRWHESQRSSE